MAGYTPSELTIVTKAKELCSYIMVVTQKSPKHFRFTFTSRIQNLALSIIENIYRANETYVSGKDASAKYRKRLDFQREALTNIKVLAYFAALATEQQCLLPKQLEQISKLTTDCQYLLMAWMNSDRKRFLEQKKTGNKET